MLEQKITNLSKSINILEQIITNLMKNNYKLEEKQLQTRVKTITN